MGPGSNIHRVELEGRGAELDALTTAVGEASLVVLWGPGGAGKSALARAWATTRHTGGALVWLDARSIRRATDLVAVLAQELGVVATDDDRESATFGAAAARGALVVVDDAAVLERDAHDALLRLARIGEATVLLTRRAQPDLAPETARVVFVGPLSEDAAIALLTRRSEIPIPDADARAIVARLDALPLAIELAAARLPILGPTELRARLDRKLDLLRPRGAGESRHATLRAAVEWSWEQLPPSLHDALLDCALFEGDFDASLAEAVLGSDAHDADDALGAHALDHLEELRRHALLRATPGGQLRLFEVVRDFVRERTRDASTRAAAEQRFERAIEARVAPTIEVVLRGGAVPAALAERQADLHAILEASRRMDTPPTPLVALALTLLLGARGSLDRAMDVARPFLEKATADLHRVRLRTALADVERKAGARVAAERSARTAAAELAALASRAEVPSLASTSTAEASAIDLVRATIDLRRVECALARANRDLEAATHAANDALDRARAIGDEARVALCLGDLGAIDQSAGAIGRARDRLAAAIATVRALGNRHAEGTATSFFAVATHRGGDPAGAEPLHAAALAIHREVGHVRLEGAELLHLAFVAHERGDLTTSDERFVVARRVLASCGARSLEALALIFHARRDGDAGDAASAELHLAEAARLAQPSWSRTIAGAALVRGHLAMGARRWAAAIEAYEAARAASAAVEVGFEALTPAYLALALAREVHERVELARIDALLDEARRRVVAFENPRLAVALAILAAAANGAHGDGPKSAATDDDRQASSEVRRALAFAARRETIAPPAPARAELNVDTSCAHVVLPSGVVVDLARRKSVRLVLAALVAARLRAPGATVDATALIAAGWPGERMREDAATKRLHTAIWTLRKLGFEGLLETLDAAYRLSPAIAVVHAEL